MEWISNRLKKNQRNGLLLFQADLPDNGKKLNFIKPVSMLKRIVQNKYKLMAFIIGLYLLVDVLQHKGQARVLFSKDFPGFPLLNLHPQSKSTLINNDKNWTKAVNTKGQLDGISPGNAGFECDIYFDTSSVTSFEVHHDPDKSTGYGLDELLQLYREKKLQSSIWLDIKNLDKSNASSALSLLIELRKKYKLKNKILIESCRPELLTAFTDSGFYTSYYAPMFDPYHLDDTALGRRADSIAAILYRSRVNGISGYYFQYAFFQYYFPQFPFHTWADKNTFSLINLFFRKKIEGQKNIAIILYP